MTKNDEKYYQAVREGVRDAFGFWMSQHNISFPDLIERAIKEAMKEYLNDHEPVA
jgi:hypothetical protein